MWEGPLFSRLTQRVQSMWQFGHSKPDKPDTCGEGQPTGRHPSESWDLSFLLGGCKGSEIPAFAGMTVGSCGAYMSYNSLILLGFD